MNHELHLEPSCLTLLPDPLAEPSCLTPLTVTHKHHHNCGSAWMILGAICNISAEPHETCISDKFRCCVSKVDALKSVIGQNKVKH
eukprot:1191626-Prorocentrum_minimum.AAC.4